MMNRRTTIVCGLAMAVPIPALSMPLPQVTFAKLAQNVLDRIVFKEVLQEPKVIGDTVRIGYVGLQHVKLVTTTDRLDIGDIVEGITVSIDRYVSVRTAHPQFEMALEQCFRMHLNEMERACGGGSSMISEQTDLKSRLLIGLPKVDEWVERSSIVRNEVTGIAFEICQGTTYRFIGEDITFVRTAWGVI